MNPPVFIDGARVLEWAWSRVPFGYVFSGDAQISIAIHGLALCRYDGAHQVYRFSCNEQWETEQDSVYVSVEEAKAMLPKQYRDVPAEWQRAA